MTQIMSAGLCEMLRTDPENGGVYRTRYERALTLIENQSTTELREAGAPLAREYGSWKNAKYRTKGLHASISDFKDFIRIHGPMPDDLTAWSLDRINPVGPYAPFNIRWLDPLGQTRNRTNTLRLKFYGHDIHLQTIALILGIPYRTAYKVFSRDPDELVSRIESASYRLKYAFPTDFSEELEAAFSKNVHGLMRLHWVQEYVQQEVMRLSDEIAETPDDPRLWLQHQHALSVLLHAAAFDKWAQEQQTRQIEFQRDLRSAGPLPTWELENIHFEPKPAPKYENFTNGSHHHG